MHGIEIYPFDSVIHHLNNWGLEQVCIATRSVRWGYFQVCCSSLVRDYVYQRGHRSLLRILTYFLVMLCKFLLEKEKKNVTSKWFEVFKSRWRHPEFWSPYSRVRFWCTRERPCVNRVRSLLSMRCLVLGYSFEPRPKSPALGTTGSVVTSGLSINGCSHPENW